MQIQTFLDSLTEEHPPHHSLPAPLQALWHAEKGDWDTAHRIAQDIPTPEGSWIHANLHREEGDLGNARYWYNRAGRPESTKPVPVERREIIEALLSP